jgi:hypothetical protein
MLVVSVGFNASVADTLCAEIAFGLLAFGNVPTVWSGKPLALNIRLVVLHDHAAVEVAFTEVELLKTLFL